MSKVGKLPINLANGVSMSIQGQQIQVTGPKGNVTYTIPQGMSVSVEDGIAYVKAENQEDRKVKAMYGLTRASIANIVKGVDSGFEKKLELSGVGYRVQMQGTALILSLGFSHPVKFEPEQGVTIAVVDNGIVITGMDKAKVGQAAAKIRSFRPPEPYKGKGIKYKDEKVRRKAGKAAKAAGAK